MRSAYLLSLVFPALLWLTACQSQPEAPPSTQQLTDLAAAIHADQVVQLTQFRECYALGGELSQQVSATREIWQLHYDDLFAAADAQLKRQQKDWISIDDQWFSLQGLQHLKQIHQTTLQKLNMAQRGVNGQKNICQTAMAAIESHAPAEVDRESRVVKALLSQSLPNNLQMPDTEQQFVQFATEQVPGRSYFTVTQALQAACPSELVLETLVNQWPKEDYIAFCQGAGLLHIDCEWGECQQRQPRATPE